MFRRNVLSSAMLYYFLFDISSVNSRMRQIKCQKTKGHFSAVALSIIFSKRLRDLWSCYQSCLVFLFCAVQTSLQLINCIKISFFHCRKTWTPGKDYKLVLQELIFVWYSSLVCVHYDACNGMNALWHCQLTLVRGRDFTCDRHHHGLE